MKHKLIYWFLPVMIAASPASFAAELGDDGLYNDPLFHESFLDLAEDATEAASDGKTLMIVIEQNGCPYCRELHEVNFARDEIREAMSAHFYTLQIDLWGSREITDFDGSTMEERDWAAQHLIQFTPTTVFYDEAGAELFRLPGYLKPFHYLSALEYVAEGAYETQPFQRYLQDKFERLNAEGVEAKVWD